MEYYVLLLRRIIAYIDCLNSLINWTHSSIGFVDHRVVVANLVTFIPITMHASYPDYVTMFDQLTDDRVIWTPYTPDRGQGWLHALEDVIQEDAPYDSREYEEYIEWYSSRTRVCCVRVVDDPPRHKAVTSDTYPTYLNSAFHCVIRIQWSVYLICFVDLQWEMHNLATSAHRMMFGERFSMTAQEIREVMDKFVEKTRQGIKLASCRRPREVVDPPVRGRGVSKGASCPTAPHPIVAGCLGRLSLGPTRTNARSRPKRGQEPHVGYALRGPVTM
uniref:PH01B001G05.11 protein n=1 Tax=Phyllostachys edulis TaxID=38705 RepID=L0P3M5_PHYED|nr:PH01B001G05.11 [Phyllostachys edulis]